MAGFYTQSEISKLGESFAACHAKMTGNDEYPIDPELMASKLFKLDILPQKQLISTGVRSGIDTTQSIIFIDYDLYMDDRQRPLSNQSIAHELGHAVFDSSVIRQISAQTVDDAYQLHQAVVATNPGIESRANMFAGAFLVPRGEMLLQIAKMLHKSYELALEVSPNITLGQVFQQMTSSPLSRYFGVSDYVIGWRFDDEAFHEEFHATPETLLRAVDQRLIASIAQKPFVPPALNQRLRALLPEDFFLYYQPQIA